MAGCFGRGSGRGNPSLSGGGLRGALERDYGQVAFRTWAGGLQRGSGHASVFNCLIVRFNLVIRGRLDDVRVYIPYRVYPRFSVNIIIPIGYTLTMMIVTHSRSTVIIVIHNTYFTQLTNWLTKQLTKWEPIDEGQRKRAFAFALALSSMAVYFGGSAHSAFIQRADAPRCGPPFRLFPDGWEVYLRRAD